MPGRITVAQVSARVDALDAKLDTILAHLAQDTPAPAQAEPKAQESSIVAAVRAASPKSARELRREVFKASGRALTEGESYTSVLRADDALRATYAQVAQALGFKRTAEYALAGMPPKKK